MPSLLCRACSIQFSNQIQLEYYVGNRSVSIEGIALERFSVSHHPSLLLASDHVSRHMMFHIFSDYRKQYASTTAEHSERII